MTAGSRRSRVVSIVAALLACICIVGAAGRPGETALVPVKARRPAPGFALADANGTPVALSRYKGRVVLLDFWATWCTGCKVEIPWYMEFAKKYEQSGLAVVGVSMDKEGWTV